MDSSSPPLWRKIQLQNFTDVDCLCSFLKLDDFQIACLEKNPSFPFQVPLRLAKKMEKGRIDDPLFLQFVPLKKKIPSSDKFHCDPVGDSLFRKTPKLLKKYEGRALLLPTSSCAMHCRYCFRQNFNYHKAMSDKDDLLFIREDFLCKEVILSGGDPLSLSNDRLSALIQDLEDIPHLKRLRFHTRFPIGIPERIESGFLKILQGSRLQIFFVLHCNHPKELDEDVLSSLQKIRLLGIPILNQSVLLKGVNDCLEVLEELCLSLSDNGIIPYYLHQLDRVAGSEEFEVSEDVGKELVRKLAERLSGYAVPKYVKEISGASSKTLI